MAEPFTIYKLAILSMLNMVDYPLTNTQLANFFLERDYTDYFRIQQVISDLQDSELILAEVTHSNTRYTITPAGKETLGFFSDKLGEGIEQDIKDYFANKSIEFKTENTILADYYKTPQQSYAVRCQYRAKDVNLIDLTLTVKSRMQAEAICANWKNQNEDVYAYLMDILVK